MYFSYCFCLAFLIRNAFCYFFTNSFPFEIFYNYHNIPQTFDLFPVIVQVPDDDYYSAREGKQFVPNFLNNRIFKRFKNTFSGLKPVNVKDKHSAYRSNSKTDHELEGKQIGFNFLNNKLFKNIKTTLDVSFNKKKETPLVVKCREKFDGTLVNNECYKFYKDELKWSEARHVCKEKGGITAELWTPDLTDAFLYQKLSYLMPEFGTAFYDYLWLGAKFDHKGEKITDLNGMDVTDTFQMNINGFHSPGDHGTEDECIGLGFYYGGFVAGSDHCDKHEYAFICEFDLTEEETSKTKLSLFKNTFRF